MFFREIIQFNYACKIKVNFKGKKNARNALGATAVLQSFYSDIWISVQNSISKAFTFVACFFQNFP